MHISKASLKIDIIFQVYNIFLGKSLQEKSLSQGDLSRSESLEKKKTLETEIENKLHMNASGWSSLNEVCHGTILFTLRSVNIIV